MKWRDVFDYNCDSGELTWLVGRRRGLIAGCIDSNGYIVVRHKGKNYYAHRIAWEIVNGDILHGMEVDHIDHDRSNNAITNLRIVNSKGNAKNKKLMTNNTTGFNGVYVSGDKFRARAMVDGVMFNIGTFDTFDDAVLARSLFNVDSFHENHGKKKRP